MAPFTTYTGGILMDRKEMINSIISGLVVAILMAIAVGIFQTKESIEEHLSKLDSQIAVITNEVHNWNDFTEKRLEQLDKRIVVLELKGKK